MTRSTPALQFSRTACCWVLLLLPVHMYCLPAADGRAATHNLLLLSCCCCCCSPAAACSCVVSSPADGVCCTVWPAAAAQTKHFCFQTPLSLSAAVPACFESVVPTVATCCC